MKKTILITGSTDGIGKLTAEKLAMERHDVYVHGRNPGKLAYTISEIRKTSGNDNVAGFVADFSSLESVRQMAVEITSKISKLDVLINNAGIYRSPSPVNQDGLDVRLMVNYLAPFLLTNKLMPLIEKGEEPRLINLSSAAQSTISSSFLYGKEQRGERDAYAQSKLAITMWSMFMAKKNPGIVVIPVNPGSLLDTKMAKEAFGQIWSPAEKGVNIIYDLAVSRKYQGITGKYFDNDHGAFERAHSDAYDEIKMQKLIEATERLLQDKI